jgi:hypothetical protein
VRNLPLAFDGHRAVQTTCLQVCTESVLAPQSEPLEFGPESWCFLWCAGRASSDQAGAGVFQGKG